MSEIDEQRRESVAEAPEPEQTAPPGPEPEPGNGDPFEGWPQAQSAAVIEDAPPDGTSVEHVRGEVDVPAGYTVLEGTPTGRRRSVAVVVSRFNGGLTNRMLQRALDAPDEAGVAQDAITGMPVAGAVELPPAAVAPAETRRDARGGAARAAVRRR